MAYNLYQVQMAKAWVERINKENNTSERFWVEQAMKGSGDMDAWSGISETKTTSTVPTGFTSKSAYLSHKLKELEEKLEVEREYRKQVEEQLKTLKEGPPSPGPLLKLEEHKLKVEQQLKAHKGKKSS